MKYSEYENIKLEDTGLMKKSCKDTVYNRLANKNEIRNLKELFELDDLNLIDYGAKSGFSAKLGYVQAKGVVKILRSFYLNEEFPYLNILEGTVKNNNIEININGSIKTISFSDAFNTMGLTFNATISLRTAVWNKEIKVIDLLQEAFEGKYTLICNSTESYKFKNRIEFILLWYYRHKTNLYLQIKTLENLRKIILNLKDKKDSEELIQIKKELNDILDIMLIDTENKQRTILELKKKLNK